MMYVYLFTSSNDLGRNIICFLSFRNLLVQKVGEKENFHNYKYDKKFNENDNPQCLSQSHTPETIIIEMEDF